MNMLNNCKIRLDLRQAGAEAFCFSKRKAGGTQYLLGRAGPRVDHGSDLSNEFICRSLEPITLRESNMPIGGMGPDLGTGPLSRGRISRHQR